MNGGFTWEYTTPLEEEKSSEPNHHFQVQNVTPPKFNMEPENKSLEKESPFGNHDFQVAC